MMKKRIATLLIFAFILGFSTVGLAADYSQDPAYLRDMADYVKENAPGIALTEEFFVVETTKNDNYKFELSATGDSVDAFFCVLARGTEASTTSGLPGYVFPVQRSSNIITISNPPTSIEPKSYDGDGYTVLRLCDARVGLNILTEVTQETTITLKISTKTNAGADWEVQKTVTYTISPESAPTESPQLSIDCTDRSSTPGIQVNAGDTVTVRCTAPADFTSSVTFTYDASAFTLVTAPAGWTSSEEGKYTGSTFPGDFTFTVNAQANDNSAAAFKIEWGEAQSFEKNVTIIFKDIVYEIGSLTKQDSAEIVQLPYNGQDQSVTVTVTDPKEGYTIQYAEGVEITYGVYEWEQKAPTLKDAVTDIIDASIIAIKITADGYRDVLKSPILFYITPAEVTITPKDTTIYVGDTAPTTFEYNVTGLLEPDTITTQPTFNIDGTVDTSKPGTYTITASGASAGDNYKILYKPGTLTVKEKTVTPGGGSGGGTHAYYTLYFVTNGGSAIGSVTGSAGSLVDLGGYVPVRSGYAFTGWYADPALTKPVYSVRLTGSTTVYAGWRPLMTPPKTGDGPSAWGWVCLLPLGCLGLAALWRRRAR